MTTTTNLSARWTCTDEKSDESTEAGGAAQLEEGTSQTTEAMMPNDNDSDDRQADRTASANRGNLRYGTRTESGSAREYGGLGNWVRNFRNQGRVIRDIYRGSNRDSSR